MENLIGKCKSLIEAVNSRLIGTENWRTKVEYIRLGLKKKKKKHWKLNLNKFIWRTYLGDPIYI